MGNLYVFAYIYMYKLNLHNNLLKIFKTKCNINIPISIDGKNKEFQRLLAFIS